MRSRFEDRAEGKARETSELEARALAADLLELHASGVAWSEVGILLRSLTDLETYLSLYADDFREIDHGQHRLLQLKIA